ncbi:hypothetical protein [Massilia sp. ST3]|uniref:hypothetical protein n=1 Tax=Massilia sp. ST3 TaxID=2824903 RepID=UPI001B83EC19|nr:hypothetical protein [Massilia sp. ST3]MBQ5949533.1 hypothetical protein [Massilia sp. ST3]MBQ5949538.1 hypothetical protein [Massilia sp. ST3]
MKTLTITDLARTEQLDRTAMSAVRGGWSMYSPSYKLGNLSYAPTHDSSINAVQDLMQEQSVLTATANESAFVKGVHVNSHVDQNGQNKIVG